VVLLKSPCQAKGAATDHCAGEDDAKPKGQQLIIVVVVKMMSSQRGSC